jgi:hypothetical protein
MKMHLSDYSLQTQSMHRQLPDKNIQCIDINLTIDCKHNAVQRHVSHINYKYNVMQGGGAHASTTSTLACRPICVCPRLYADLIWISYRWECVCYICVHYHACMPAHIRKLDVDTVHECAYMLCIMYVYMFTHNSGKTLVLKSQQKMVCMMYQACSTHSTTSAP